MISTVTTSTISTVNIAGSFAIIGVVLLVGLMIQKELIASLSGDRVQKFRKILNIGIAPLLVVFVLVVVSKILTILQ